MRFKMGYSKKIFLKDGVFPSKFDCQKDCRKRLWCDATTSETGFQKRQKLDCIKGEESQLHENLAERTELEFLSK